MYNLIAILTMIILENERKNTENWKLDSKIIKIECIYLKFTL